MRRVAALCSIGVGIGLIVFTFTSSAFLRTHDGQVIIDRFHPTVTPAGFQAFHDVATESVVGVGDLTSKAYPTFARALGMTGPQFQAYLRTHYNDITRGVDTVNGLPTFTAPVVNGVGRLPHGFAPVYAIPVKGLPLTSVPWILLALGGALIVLGVLIWTLPGNWPVVAALVAGAGMIIVPFALNLPSKVSDTGKMLKLADYGLSPYAATKSEQAAYYTDDMVRQLQTQLFPVVAARLHETPAQLNRQLATAAPKFSKFLGDWPKIGPGTIAFAAQIRVSVSQYRNARAFPFEATPWLIVALGGLLVVVSGAALVPRGSRVAQPATPSPA